LQVKRAFIFSEGKGAIFILENRQQLIGALLEMAAQPLDFLFKLFNAFGLVWEQTDQLGLFRARQRLLESISLLNSHLYIILISFDFSKWR